MFLSHLQDIHALGVSSRKSTQDSTRPEPLLASSMEYIDNSQLLIAVIQKPDPFPGKLAFQRPL